MSTEPSVERIRELFDYDPESGVLTWKVRPANNVQVGSVAGSRMAQGYMRTRLGKQSWLNHRLIWAYVHGVWPAGEIDHINEDKTDNRIANLRDVTRGQNLQNRRRANVNNVSGYRGVGVAKNRWVAQIQVDGKSLHLGLFDDPADAHACYLAARARLHPCSPEAAA